MIIIDVLRRNKTLVDIKKHNSMVPIKISEHEACTILRLFGNKQQTRCDVP